MEQWQGTTVSIKIRTCLLLMSCKGKFSAISNSNSVGYCHVHTLHTFPVWGIHAYCHCALVYCTVFFLLWQAGVVIEYHYRIRQTGCNQWLYHTANPWNVRINTIWTNYMNESCSLTVDIHCSKNIIWFILWWVWLSFYIFISIRWNVLMNLQSVKQSLPFWWNIVIS